MRRPDAARLERRISLHDRKHFELKLEYEPEEREAHTTYLVEAFVFLPANLNVTESTAPRELLYADILNYIRLKTPEQSWAALVSSPGSPLVRAEEELSEVERGGDGARFRYECKLLACEFRVAFGDVIEDVMSQLGPEPDCDQVQAVGEGLEAAVQDVAPVLDRYRSLLGRVERPGVPADVRVAFGLADEWMSLAVEQRLRRAIVRLTRAKVACDAKEGVSACKARLLETILTEERHRRKRGYPSVIDPQSDNERYVSRTSLLKKYASSALFLRILRRGAPRQWLELAFATAAGIAMAATLVVTFWAQARYANVSMQFFLILVVAYMLKDRLKEGAKQSFARALRRRLWDRRVVITDPVGERLGQLWEKIQYEESEHVPAEVREIRRLGKDDAELEAEEELRETVFHYKKRIVLQPSDWFLRRGGRGVTDIVRFNVNRWLRDMDEPHEIIEFMDPKTQELTPLRAAKVYKVDVVFRFCAAEDEPPVSSLLRLVLDRRGIKRIERWESDGSRKKIQRRSSVPPGPSRGTGGPV